MKKPTLYDVYCGAGGATKGYQLAGFRVVGVDIKPQPHYCGDDFLEMDAFEFFARCERGEFPSPNAWHCSPPCQAYSRLRHLPWLKGREYPELLAPTWEALETTGLPWAIENVEDAPMPYSIVLCGTMFDLPVYRHRRFGLSHMAMQPCHPRHQATIAAGRASMAKRYRESAGITGVIVKESNRGSLAGHATGAKETGRLMGIDWMNRDELSQAIPPAYTEFIGRQLIAVLAHKETLCPTR